MFDRDKLIADLVVDESARSDVYDDHDGKRIVAGKIVVGNPTTGIGHALNQRMWTDEQMRTICGWDIDAVCMPLYTELPWLTEAPEPVQRALANMTFNLGVEGLLKFQTFLSMLRAKNYTGAADDLKTTAWARQVSDRASRIEALIRGIT